MTAEKVTLIAHRPANFHTQNINANSAWSEFISVAKNFLGNNMFSDYSQHIEYLMFHFQQLGCDTGIKIHFLFSHLGCCPENFGNLSE